MKHKVALFKANNMSSNFFFFIFYVILFYLFIFSIFLNFISFYFILSPCYILQYSRWRYAPKNSRFNPS